MSDWMPSQAYYDVGTDESIPDACEECDCEDRYHFDEGCECKCHVEDDDYDGDIGRDDWYE